MSEGIDSLYEYIEKLRRQKGELEGDLAKILTLLQRTTVELMTALEAAADALDAADAHEPCVAARAAIEEVLDLRQLFITNLVRGNEESSPAL